MRQARYGKSVIGTFPTPEEARRTPVQAARGPLPMSHACGACGAQAALALAPHYAARAAAAALRQPAATPLASTDASHKLRSLCRWRCDAAAALVVALKLRTDLNITRAMRLVDLYSQRIQPTPAPAGGYAYLLADRLVGAAPAVRSHS